MKISKQRLRQIIKEELANEGCPMDDGPAPEEMDPVGEPGGGEDPAALAAELADLAQRLSAALGGTDMVPAGEEEVVIDMGATGGF